MTLLNAGHKESAASLAAAVVERHADLGISLADASIKSATDNQ